MADGTDRGCSNGTMRGRLDILNESAWTEEEEEGRKRGGRKCIGLDKMGETTIRKMGTRVHMLTHFKEGN